MGEALVLLNPIKNPSYNPNLSMHSNTAQQPSTDTYGPPIFYEGSQSKEANSRNENRASPDFKGGNSVIERDAESTERTEETQKNMDGVAIEREGHPIVQSDYN